MPTVIKEGNAQFKSEVTENKDLDWFNILPQYEDGYWDVRKPCDDGYRFKTIDEDLFDFIKPGNMMSVHDIFTKYMKGEQI